MTYREKTRAAFLAAVMVLSVVALGMVGAGAATLPDGTYHDVSSDAFEAGINTGDTRIPTDRTDADIADGLLTKAEDGPVTAVLRLAEIDRSRLTGDRDAVVGQLKSHARQSQQPIVDAASNLDSVAVLNRLWIANAVIVETDAEGLEALAQVPGVDRIHPNFELTVPKSSQGGAGSGGGGGDAAGSDDVSATQDHTYGLEMINAPQVWDEYNNQGEGAKVAVLDTGYDNDHPDLPEIHPDDQWQEFDSNGRQVDSDPTVFGDHGVHVSGTVVGSDNPSVVPRAFGVAPEATIYHGAVLTDCGQQECNGSFAQVTSGMQYAVDEWEVHILGMSLGATGYHSEMIAPSENARAAGTILAASIGNAGPGTSGSPGNVYPNVASGAVDENKNNASFSGGEIVDAESEWGSDAPGYWPDTYVVPDAVAPGVDVCSTIAGGYSCGYSMTGMSQAHVAGLFALMTSQAGGAVDRDVFRNIVEQTASQPPQAPSGDPNTRYGNGVIDAFAAVREVDPGGAAVDVAVVGNDPAALGNTVAGDVSTAEVTAAEEVSEDSDLTDLAAELDSRLADGLFNVETVFVQDLKNDPSIVEMYDVHVVNDLGDRLSGNGDYIPPELDLEDEWKDMLSDDQGVVYLDSGSIDEGDAVQVFALDNTGIGGGYIDPDGPYYPPNPDDVDAQNPFDDQDLNLEIRDDHPIFTDIGNPGDTVTVATNKSFMLWMDQYEGTLLAEGSLATEPGQEAVMLETDRDGPTEIFYTAGGVNPTFDPIDEFTENGLQILTNTVEYLSPVNTSADTNVSIRLNDRSLIAGQSVVFYAALDDVDGAVSSFDWEFGDGTMATGQSVSHAYTAAGSYTVTLQVETQDGRQFTTNREVVVDPVQSTYDITGLTPYLDDAPIGEYTHVEGLDLNLSYGVSVTQPSSTANVTFELGNITHTDTDGSDGWRFPVPTTQLTQNETLTVTAYGTNGERAVASRSLTVLETPEWFDLLDPVRQFKQRPVIELQGEFPADGGSAVQLPNQFPFADDVPLPVVGSSQSNNLKATVSVRVNLRTTEATVGVGGKADYDLSTRVDVSGSVSGSASMRLYEMDVVGGKLTAQAGADIMFPGIPSPGFVVPPGIPIPPGIVKLYPSFGIQVGAEAAFDEVDSVNNTNPVAFELTQGSITPELYAEQEVGQIVDPYKLTFGLQEGVNTTIPFPSFEPIYGNAFAEVFVEASTPGFTARISYPPGEDRFAYRFGPLGGGSGATAGLPGTQTSGSPPTVSWQPVNKTGPAPPGRQPSQRVAATRAGTNVPSVAPAAIADARITNNTVADETPAIAQTGSDGSTLVWSQQQIDRSVFNGREILASNSTDGTSFGGSTAVTDDNVSDYYPAIAAADDRSDSALAAFTTFDRTFNSSNTTGPGDLYPHGEIRVARLNDSTWEPPTFLTNDSAFDFQPTVVSQDDNWTVAWTRDADANLSTWRDREVAYVQYDENGQVGPVHSIDEARSPVLTTINGTTRIAYLDMQGGERSGQLVMGDLQRGQSSPVTRATYPVENLTDVAAANGTVVWTTADAQPWMQVATTDDVRNLSAPEGLSPPQSVTLGSRSDRLLLTFRAASPNSSVAEAYYKPRVDGVWLPARQYASGADRDLTYWQTTTTGTDDGFTSVTAGKVLDSEQKDDLFAFRTQFRPDLAVSVPDRPENVTVGTDLNLTVNVTNNGDIPTNATTVAISNGSGIVANSSVPVLQPGASIERSLAAVLDETGQVTVAVDPDGQIQEHDDTNNQKTLRLHRPDLAVTDRTVTRRDGTIQVNATIGNPSPVTAPAVSYRYSNGPTLNRSGSVGPIPPQSTREVSVDFTPGNLSSSLPLTIRVDPAQRLFESDETNNTLVGPIKKPDVRLSKEQVNYYRQNGTVVASVLVENAGIGGGEGTIQVSYAANGSAIASQPFKVGPARTTGSSTFSRERVVLPRVGENTTVTLNAAVRPRDSRTSSIVDRAATTDSIELNTTVLPPTGSLRLSRTPAIFNHSLLVGVSASDDGTVTSYDWTVTNGTIVGNNTTGDILTVVPDNASLLSAGVTLTDDDGLTEQVVRTVTITPNQRPVIADYATDQGIVKMPGLFDAIDDWRAGTIDTVFLLDVIDAWRSEKPIL